MVAELTGVSRPSVGAIERDKREPRATELMRVASLFRVRPESLMQGRLERMIVPDAAFRTDRGREGARLEAHDRFELAVAIEQLAAWPPAGDLPLFSDRHPMNVVGRQVREWLRAPRTGCIDLFRLLDVVPGLRLSFTALASLSGALLRLDGRACILVNADQPDDRLRWSAAHELAHLVFGHDLQRAEHIDAHGAAIRPEDKTADIFAAELLMPGEDVLRTVQERMVPDLTPEAVFELSRAYCVSYAAMLYRLANLQVLPFEAVEALRAERPTEIARRVGEVEGVAFDVVGVASTVLEGLAKRGALPLGWARDFDPITGPSHLRLIQAECLRGYFRQVDIRKRTSSVNEVYERVAAWVAENFPYSG